ncbi:Oxidoreductase ptaJ [Colletotrichum spinosum]|uniref:Oxidoreductase ptaJ n=1 Tax=Colletotrichum spinosum TaxID=1347390 RepID=A0A4R8Q2T0_9PEZI|nr:Oxidoreductase ptaJ [Colletotrichum spinosum]
MSASALADRVSSIRLEPGKDVGILHVPTVNTEAVQAAGRVLQQNHDDIHPFFSYMDRDGVHMHNHLVHHALTLVALGANSDQVRHFYDINTPYQRPAVPINEGVLGNLSQSSVYKKSLGNEDNYTSFLRFFESEIAAKGVPGVLQEYMFAEDFKSDDMFVRMYMGLLHPLIHLGFGVEFNQPAIVAEALAQAAVHSDDYFFTFFHEADALAKRPGVPKKSLAELVDLAAADENCRKAANSEIFDKMLDGVLKNAKTEFLNLAVQYRVGEDEIEVRTAELCNATAYITVGAQRLNKSPRMDFFLLHSLNVSIFHGVFAKQSWIPNSAKARLLTYTGRLALLTHISMGAPTLNLDVIRNYNAVNTESSWETVIERAVNHPDDGHAAKMIRALKYAEQVTAPYTGRAEFRVKGGDFLKAGVAIVDTLNPKGGKAGPYEDESWIRGAGFDDVWDSVPNA